MKLQEELLVKDILAHAKSLAYKHAKSSGATPLLTLEDVEKAIRSHKPAMELLERNFRDILPEKFLESEESLDIDASSYEHTPIQIDDMLERVISRAESLASSMTPNELNPETALTAFLSAFFSMKFQENKEEWMAAFNRLCSNGVYSIREYVKKIGGYLRDEIKGQEHAIRTVEKALFRMFLTGQSKIEKDGPAGFFLFAGPPGTGKTLLSKSLTKYLKRPLKRFDLNCFSTPSDHEALIGSPKIFAKAAEGELTGFVKKHPDAVLLFDEVEKAHPNTIKIFLQIIDEGYLRDHFTDEHVSFRDAVVIFTTNAGKTLYDDLNYAPYLKIFPDIQRTALLDVLSSEAGLSGENVFPAALCSRFSKGSVVLFNRLGPAELAEISRHELKKIVQMCQEQINKEIKVDDMVLQCILLQEGGLLDARSVRPRLEGFIMDAIFSQTASTEPEIWDRVKSIHISLDFEHESEKIAKILQTKNAEQKYCICAVMPEDSQAYEHLKLIEEVRDKKILWKQAANRDKAYDTIANTQVDLVVLDMEIDMDLKTHEDTIFSITGRRWGSPRYWHGIEALENIALHWPDIPVILYFHADRDNENEKQWIEETIQQCTEIGGVKDIIVGDLTDNENSTTLMDFKKIIDRQLDAVDLEKAYRFFKRSNKVLKFELSPKIKDDTLQLRLCNLNEITAWKASVLGSAVHSCIIPNVTFDDVICENEISDILNKIAEKLHQWSAKVTNFRLPRGILLSGPPGTGKTMLAKAFAHTSSAPFFTVSASNFMAENSLDASAQIRELFAKAREYAPSVIFMDEIDAIGFQRGIRNTPSPVLNELLIQLDGFSASPAPPVILLGATNFADRLDPALIRRFDLILSGNLPDIEEIKKYLQLTVKKQTRLQGGLDENFEELAKEMEGLSFADIENIFNLALIYSSDSSVAISGDALRQALGFYRTRERGA